MTTLIAGPSDQISPGDIQKMAESASRLLAGTAPITVTLGKILYHPEAIMLAATPATALTPIREAALAATREITGTGGQPENRLWTPHITICYSTSRQPAGPIVSALGRDLPERRFQVSSVSLVISKDRNACGTGIRLRRSASAREHQQRSFPDRPDVPLRNVRAGHASLADGVSGQVRANRGLVDPDEPPRDPVSRQVAAVHQAVHGKRADA